MRDLSEFLTEREIFILEEGKMRTQKEIAWMLGLSGSRVNAINQQTERKLRQEKLREQADPDNQVPVTVTLQKNDLYVLDRALMEYIVYMNKKRIAPLFPGDSLGDVDYEASQKLRNILQETIK